MTSAPATARATQPQPAIVSGGPARGPKATPRRGVNWLAILTVVLLLAGVGVGVYLAFFRPRAVATMTVPRRTLVRAFYATGTVRPDNEYVMKAKTQGAVTELAVRENARVKRGQLLAKVDDKQLRFEADKAAAELKEAQAQAADDAPQRAELTARLTEAKQQLAIAERLLKASEATLAKGASNVNEVEELRRSHVQWANAVAALEGQLGTWRIQSKRAMEVAEANLRKAQANLMDTEIRSPIDGVVLERYVERDQMMSVNEKMFLVAAEDDKLMKAAVDEEDVAHVTTGQKVLMQLYSYTDSIDKPFEGRVVEVLPTANPANKTFEVKVRFDDPPKSLRVGMTAELNFIDETMERRNVLAVPTMAVMDNKVFRPAGGKYEPVEVKTGLRTLDWVEVVSGLSEGETIVSDAKAVAPVKLPPQKQPIVPTRKGDLEGEK